MDGRRPEIQRFLMIFEVHRMRFTFVADCATVHGYSSRSRSYRFFPDERSISGAGLSPRLSRSSWAYLVAAFYVSIAQDDAEIAPRAVIVIKAGVQKLEAVVKARREIGVDRTSHPKAGCESRISAELESREGRLVVTRNAQDELKLRLDSF